MSFQNFAQNTPSQSENYVTSSTPYSYPNVQYGETITRIAQPGNSFQGHPAQSVVYQGIGPGSQLVQEKKS